MPWTKCQMEPRPWRSWLNTGAGLLVVHSHCQLCRTLMLVKAQAAATAARRLKRKVEEEEEELAELAVKIIERADQVLYWVLNIIESLGFPGGRQIGEIKSRRSIGRLVQWG